MQDTQETRVRSLGGEDALEEEMASPVFMPRESHGQGSLVGYSPWGGKESDTTEQACENTISTLTPFQCVLHSGGRKELSSKPG